MHTEKRESHQRFSFLAFLFQYLCNLCRSARNNDRRHNVCEHSRSAQTAEDHPQQPDHDRINIKIFSDTSAHTTQYTIVIRFHQSLCFHNSFLLTCCFCLLDTHGTGTAVQCDRIVSIIILFLCFVERMIVLSKHGQPSQSAC